MLRRSLSRLLLCLLLAIPANAQWVIQSSGAPSAGVTDENFYDNPDGSCRNMGSGFDGPAQLPTACFNTALVNTPSPGATYWVCPPLQTVPAGCNGTPFTTIQKALDATKPGANPSIPCGSTIIIASTTTGTPSGTRLVYDEALIIPQVHCDAAHWMTVRSDQLSAMLPGVRVSPAFVGAPSMPDRPPYSQPATAGTYMPQIRSSHFSQPAMIFALPTVTTGVVPAYWRFSGLWFAQPGLGSLVCSGHNCLDGWKAALIESGCFSDTTAVLCPDHIIFDRLLISADDLTGNAVNSVCFGIRTTGTSVAVIDSYIFEQQARVGGLGGNCEPHAIGSGNTNALSQGPYKYVNNYLEASGENIFWGGSKSKSAPVNVQVRRNHLYKPINLWMPGRPGYLGVVILVKNLGESKDLHQALIEGNIYQNIWYGPDANGVFTSDQDGSAVLLHSAPILNPASPANHRAIGQDMTFRYNFLQHSVKGAHIGITGCSACVNFPPGLTAGLTQRVSVHDNVFDDISRRFFTEPNIGSGGFDGTSVGHFNAFENVGSNGNLNNVKVDHNTFVTSWYSQDITVASIVVSSGTATLTGTGPPVPRQGGTGFVAGRNVMIWASCAGYNQKPTIATIVSTTPATFTYATNLPNGTCNTGFVSLLAASTPGTVDLGEATTDTPLESVVETGTLAAVRMGSFPPQIEMCVSAGVPAGCVGSSQFTVWGLTGTLNCYNSNQSAASCPPSGTPAHWTLAGRAHCTGSGTGTILGSGSVSLCNAAGQDIFFWNHPTSGLPAAAATALSYLSYWASLGRENFGPNPNPAWPGMIYTNNIFAGKVQQTTGDCMVPGHTRAGTAPVLNKCGVVETTGAGAYRFSCNVVISHAIPLLDTPTDTLPPLNEDTLDHTYETVGFANFNFDNMGNGVTSLSDLALDSTSRFHGGISGCDGKDTGADINLLQTYTNGVQ